MARTATKKNPTTVARGVRWPADLHSRLVAAIGPDGNFSPFVVDLVRKALDGKKAA